MNDQQVRYVRLRYTATGALAALAAAGAIAGTVALASTPSAKTPGHAAQANCSTIKAPTSAGPDKAGAPKPAPSPQPFLNDIHQLVENGTITAAEGQTVDREILAGRVDTDSLTSSGFTQAQLDAVNQALENTKRALAAAVPRPSK